MINEDALEYMNNQRLAKSILHLLKDHFKKQFADLTEWDARLEELQIVNHRHIKITTEGAPIGSVLHRGLPKSLVIVSDDANSPTTSKVESLIKIFCKPKPDANLTKNSWVK